jgi:hypothetical protein
MIPTADPRNIGPAVATILLKRARNNGSSRKGSRASNLGKIARGENQQ